MKTCSFHIISSVFCLFLITSCEKENGRVIDPNYASPFLFSVGLNPSSLNLDLDTTGNVVYLGNNNYRISLQVDGRALTQFSDPPNHALVGVMKPGAGSVFAKVVLPIQQNRGDTLFADSISFAVARADVGLWRFAFSIETISGNVSNSVQRTLLITRRNSRPAIIAVSIPDSVTVGSLPSPDSTFLVTAAVADSDGVDDIADVRFLSLKPDSTFANCGFPIPMFDDGSANIVFPPSGRSGDGLAGDGVYSVKVRLVAVSLNTRCPPPDTVYTQRGIYQFIFSAIDHSGAESAPVTRIIKVK